MWALIISYWFPVATLPSPTIRWQEVENKRHRREPTLLPDGSRQRKEAAVKSVINKSSSDAQLDSEALHALVIELTAVNQKAAL